MRSFFRGRRRNERKRGTALAIAIMVMIMLSAIGMLALNSASFDVVSAGAIAHRARAEAVAETGDVLGRCQACQAIDGIVLAMESQRQALGTSAAFTINETTLAAGVDGGQIFRPPDATMGRGTFGDLDASGAIAPTIQVVIDRQRESAPVAGYSMRESVGADSGALCFRYYRFTSTGTYFPPGSGSNGLQAQHRSFVKAGPMPCSAL